MLKFIEKTYVYLFYCFFGLYPFLIYPWGKSYYYANVKAYYFMGFVLLAALLLLLKAWVKRENLVWKVAALDGLLIAFLLLIGISTLHSPDKSLVGVGTQHQGLLVMISCILLFRLASRLRSSQLERLLQWIIMGSFFACVYSILQYTHLAFLPQDSVFIFGGRTFSFFDNPDYFGSYLALIIPVTVVACLLSQGGKKRILYSFVFCIQFLSLIESQTRSAWLGIAVGFVMVSVWLVWKRRELLKNWAWMILAAGVIFAFSNLFSNQMILSRALTVTNDVQKIVSNQDPGYAGASRWYIWQVSLPLIQHHFWLGTGPNTFEQAFYSQDLAQAQKYLGTGKIYDENNDYLQIALTMGVPALVVYLAILAIILIKGFRRINELDHHQQLVSLGILAAIIGYLVQAFFNISVISVAPYFWLVLGLAVRGTAPD